jgi:hypothetical protein
VICICPSVQQLRYDIAKINIFNSYTAEIMRMQRPPKYLLGASTHLISVDMG